MPPRFDTAVVVRDGLWGNKTSPMCKGHGSTVQLQGKHCSYVVLMRCGWASWIKQFMACLSNAESCSCYALTLSAANTCAANLGKYDCLVMNCAPLSLVPSNVTTTSAPKDCMQPIHAFSTPAHSNLTLQQFLATLLRAAAAAT